MTRNLKILCVAGALLVGCTTPSTPGPPAPPVTPAPPPTPTPTPPATAVLAITPVTNARPGELYTASQEFVVDWITGPTPVSFSGGGGLLLINGISAPLETVVLPGDRVTVAMNAPAAWSTARQGTLRIGDRQGVFSVTTAASESQVVTGPGPIRLRSLTPVPLGGQVTSEAVQHPPYRQPMTVTVTGGELIVDGQVVPSNTAVIDYGQSFRVRLQTPTEENATVTASVDFNGTAYQYTVTTPRSHFQLPAPVTRVLSSQETLWDIRVKDLNRDGLDDLTLLSTTDTYPRPSTFPLTANTFLSTGDGRFLPAGSCQDNAGPGLGSEGEAVVTDVDGDGNKDVVLLRNDLEVRSIHSRLSVCLGDGQGHLKANTLLRDLNFRGARAEAGDVDGDGLEDLVVVDGDRRLVWMKNVGGTYGASQDVAYSVTAVGYRLELGTLTVGPLTTTTRSDIVVSNGSCQVYSAVNGVPAPVARGNVLANEIADVDGDGVRDLISVNGKDDGRVTICYRNADGSVRESWTSSPLAIQTFALGVALLANDDLLVDAVGATKTEIYSETEGITVFPNLGNGTFGWSGEGIEYGLAAPEQRGDVRFVLKGQFNRDGKEDVLALVAAPYVNGVQGTQGLRAVTFLRK